MIDSPRSTRPTLAGGREEVEQTVAGSMDRRALRRRGPSLALIGALLWACGAQNAADPRLVVLYSTCTVNKDYLGPYNEGVSFTPGLDRFAEEAAVFRSHRTESGVSGTSFASIYAGVQADRHGVFKHPRALSEDLYLIFEAFADAGYETFYWAAHGMTEPELAYGQGVDDANVERRLLSGRDERFLAILDRLEADPSYRAFVVTSFSVTHAPYDLSHVPLFLKRHPEEAGGLTREEIQEYFRIFQRNASELQTGYAEVAQRLGLGDDGIARLADVVDLVYKSKVHVLDTLFGSVQEAVDEHGLADTSLIAFTADHGQQLYNEDRLFQWTHGPDLAPEVIDVPLLIKGPASLVPARTIEDVTRSIDVYPTLAGLSGIALPAEAGIEGADLSPGLRGEEPFPPLRAYSHGTLRRYKYFDPDVIDNIWASSRVGPTLYTWRNQGGAWDLTVESVAPEDAGAVLDREDPVHRAAAEDLWAYRERMIAAYREQNPDEPGSKQEELDILTEDEARALKALGYIE